MPINVPGFASSTKTPGIYLAVVLGGPGTSAGVAPKKILVMGNIIESNITGASPTLSVTAGTASAGVAIQVFDESQALTAFGQGSELHLMCAQVFKHYPAATLWAIPIAKAGGASPGSMTITPTNAPTSAWTLRVWIAGRMIECNFTTADTVVTIGTAIATAINAVAKMPVTAQAAAVTGVVTVTAKCPGARNSAIQVRAQLIAGTSVVKLASGGSLSGTMGGTTIALSSSSLSGGTGTDSVTTALAAIAATKYDRIVLAQNDSTNINLVRDQLNSQAGVSTQIRQQAVACSVDTYANSVTLATAVNAARVQIVWHYRSDALPGEVAAATAAARLIGDSVAGDSLVGEATDEAANLNGMILAGIPVQDNIADRPLPTQVESALNNGLTPLVPSNALPGAVQIVASITSRFIDAQGLPNYSVWKTKIVTVSDFVADDLQSDLFNTYRGFKLAADQTDPIKIQGVATPNAVKARIYSKLKGYEEAGKITGVDSLLPLLVVQLDANWNSRLLANIPEMPIPDFDQVAGIVQQQ